MRNFTFCAAFSALMVCSSAAVAQTVKPSEALLKVLTKNLNVAKKAPAKDAAPSIWRATHETEYSYDEETLELIKEADYYSEFDKNGYVTKYTEVSGDGSKAVRTNTLNENSMCVFQLDEDVYEDGTIVPVARRTVEYDSIVTDVIIKRLAEAYDEDLGWYESGNCYTRTITRNADGNVTSEVIAVPYEGIYDPTQRTTITYKDGKADRYMLEVLVNGSTAGTFEWETSIALKDIVWENTNGQILGEVSDFYEGDNRIKSANIYNIQAEGEEYVYATLSVNYGDYGSYTATLDYPNYYSRAIYAKTYSDANGSYVNTVKQYTDYDMNGKYTSDELEDYQKYVEQYDDHGNITLTENYDISEDAESPADIVVSDATKIENTYDPTYDQLAEEVYYYYDSELGEYAPFMKVVHDTFVDVANPTTAISSAKADATDGQAVYNMQGVKVGDKLSNLPSGLYIQKIGGKTIKVVK